MQPTRKKTRLATEVVSPLQLIAEVAGFTLSPEEEAELLLSIAEADRGEMVCAEEVLARLARRHTAE